MDLPGAWAQIQQCASRRQQCHTARKEQCIQWWTAHWSLQQTPRLLLCLLQELPWWERTQEELLQVCVCSLLRAAFGLQTINKTPNFPVHFYFSPWQPPFHHRRDQLAVSCFSLTLRLLFSPQPRPHRSHRCSLSLAYGSMFNFSFNFLKQWNGIEVQEWGMLLTLQCSQRYPPAHRFWLQDRTLLGAL